MAALGRLGRVLSSSMRPAVILQHRRTTTIRQMPAFKYQQVNFSEQYRHASTAIRAADSAIRNDVIGLTDYGRHLELKLDDGTWTKFHPVWLRHECSCSECRPPPSGVKIYDPAEIPDKLTLKSVTNDDGEITITWNEIGHEGKVTIDFLKAKDYSDSARRRRSLERDSCYLTGPKVPEVEYEHIMNTEEGLLKWLEYVNDYGAAIVKNAPRVDGTLKKLVPKITNLINTFYGETLLVANTKEERAFSSDSLGLHVDFVYHHSNPGVIFLHCIEYDDGVTGGETVLIDAFLVADQMRKDHPEEFETLCTVPATFHRTMGNDTNQFSLTARKPHFEVNSEGKLIRMNWEQRLEDALSIPEDQIEKYYKAYHLLAKLLKTSPNRIEYRQQPGDIQTLNNTRVLHSRKEFNIHSGQRKVEVGYASLDELRGRFEYMKKGLTVKRTSLY